MTKGFCDTLFQLSAPNEENGAIDDAVIITWQMLVLIASHDWKSHVHLMLIIVT